MAENSALIARLDHLRQGNSERPLAVLVGSGLSIGAVAGVPEIARTIRGIFQDTPDWEDFQLFVPDDDAGESYRAAFNFLADRRGPDAPDKVVRAAVYRAYRFESHDRQDYSDECMATMQSRPDSWSVPAGVTHVARYIRALAPAFRGPILTTNFDPLLEVAFERLGVPATSVTLTTDGGFAQTSASLHGVKIVHVHGFWSKNNTINYDVQLLAERPQLMQDIADVLKTHTVLVLGYAGWLDVVSKAIRSELDAGRGELLDILWAVHEPSIESAAGRVRELKQLLDERCPGRARFFHGVEAASLFSHPRLKDSSPPPARSAPAAVVASTVDPLAGWLNVSSALSGLSQMGGDAETRASFYDGRQPTWIDALDRTLAIRDLDIRLEAAVNAALQRRLSAQVNIVAATGEGKSLAMLRCAASLAGREDLDVLWRRVAERPKNPFVRSAGADRQSVYFIDNAHDLRDELVLWSRHVTDNPQEKVVIVCAAHSATALSRVIQTTNVIAPPMSPLDAESLVAAFAKDGATGLARLNGLSSSDEQQRALLAAAAGGPDKVTMSLFGAMLSVRTGDGLQEHVSDMMVRLSSGADFGGFTLSDTLSIVALRESIGLGATPLDLLSSMLNITRGQLSLDVLTALGDEAAISFDSRSAATRHPLIARAVMDVRRNARTLGDLVSTVVASSVLAIDRVGFTDDLAEMVYLHKKLDDDELGLIATRAAFEQKPTRLSYLCSYSSALRHVGRQEIAERLLREARPRLYEFEDFNTGRGSFFQEWALCRAAEGDEFGNVLLSVEVLRSLAGRFWASTDATARALNAIATASRRAHNMEKRYLLSRAAYVFADLGLVLVAPGQTARTLEENRTWAVQQGVNRTYTVDDVARMLSELQAFARSRTSSSAAAGAVGRTGEVQGLGAFVQRLLDRRSGQDR